jgi:GNAT superfamily N-acetyltransferase
VTGSFTLTFTMSADKNGRLAKKREKMDIKMDIMIITAKPGDVEQLQCLFKKMFEIYCFEQDVNYPYSEHGTDYLKDRISTGMCITAQAHGKIIGFVTGSISDTLPFKTYRKHGFIENVFIEEEYRNRGIGKRLIKRLVDIYHSCGINRIHTDSEDRPELRQFYKSIGFIESGILYELRV